MTQVNNIGVRIILTIYEDDAVLNISAASSKSIIIRKPDGTILTVAATFYTDGSDGKLYYDTISTDLDVSGYFKTQAFVVIGGGTYKSSIATFPVSCNLE